MLPFISENCKCTKKGRSLFFFNPTPMYPSHAVQHTLFTSNNIRPLLLFLQVLGLKIKTIYALMRGKDTTNNYKLHCPDAELLLLLPLGISLEISRNVFAKN